MAPTMDLITFKGTIRSTLYAVSSGKISPMEIVRMWLEDVPEYRRTVFVELVKEFPEVMNQMKPIFELCKMLEISEINDELQPD